MATRKRNFITKLLGEEGEILNEQMAGLCRFGAQRRTLSSRRLHRDQFNPACPKGGAVLQPAGLGGAVDQGSQKRGKMDEAVLSRFCGQPGAAATVRAGLQFGQFPAAGGAAPSSASLDIDDATGKNAGQRGLGS